MTQYHEAHYQDNAASGVILATVGPNGATYQNGGAGQETQEMRVAGPTAQRPYALRVGSIRSGQSFADYLQFPAIVASSATATMALICRRYDAVGSFGGYMMSPGANPNYCGMISPYNTTDGLGYYHGTIASANQTDRRLRVPLDEWVMLWLRTEPTRAVFGIMDLAGRWNHAINVDTHAAISVASAITIGWGGFSQGARLAPIDVCGSAGWVDEAKSVAELRSWLESQVGALGEPTPSVPIASGSATSALALLSGTTQRVTLIGDSTGDGLAKGLDRSLCGASGGPYGIPNRFAAGWYGNSVKTGVSASATPAAYNGSMTSHKVHEWTFDGSTSSSGGALTRTINHAGLGPDGYVQGRDENLRMYGRDLVQCAALEGHDLQLRVPIYKHPAGATNACAEITLDIDGVEIATSAAFGGYSPTAGWVYETLLIPSADLPLSYTTITARLNIAASVATQAGKTLVSCGFGVELINPSLARGSLIHCLAQGGTAPAQHWANSDFCSDVQFAVLGLTAPALIIAHGLNRDTGTETAEDHRDAQLQLIDRYRGIVPAGQVHLASPHATDTTCGGYAGGEDWRTRGDHLCVAERSGVNHYNVARVLPEREILRGTGREEWSNFDNGHAFRGGDLVQSSGVVYIAKTNHTKTSGSSAPASDSTNWSTTSVSTATLNALPGYTAGGSPRATWHNMLNGDDVTHAHPHGYQHAAQAFAFALAWLARLSESDVALSIDQLTAAVGELTQKQPRVNQRATYRLQLSDRRDERYECTAPVRLRPGVVGGTTVSVDLSPVFGDALVDEVGTPVVTGDATSLTCAALGPHEYTRAMVQLAGSIVAGETVVVDVPVTLDNEEEELVRFEVRGLAA